MVRRTPVVFADALGAWVKLENLQPTGSFKVRGAAAKLAELGDGVARVITASAGNHGLGVAYAARAAGRGIAVEVIVPEGTPAVKRDGIAALGATVTIEGADYDAAEAVARRRAADEGLVFVPAFDDDAVIRGNGDGLAAELLDQLPELRRVVCSVGGGGMIGGIARALAGRGVDVVGAQPAVNCAMFESLRDGRAHVAYAGEVTIAEGCAGGVAERTYALAREHGVRVVTVSEAAIRRAVAFCYYTLGTIAEPSGAVGVAALMEREVTPADAGATVVIISGGNIDPDRLDDMLRE